MIISIITATFNVESTIETAIKSVINQSYSAIEYIIIDGGSTDKTLNIINKYKSNIHHLISEPDTGIYDALNKGIQKATGDVIAFLHADDLYDNNLIIEKIANTFKRGDYDAVYGDLEYVQHQNPNKVIRYWKSEPFKPSLLKKGWMPAHPTLFVRRNIYQTIGNFNLNYKISADYDFILRFFSKPNYSFCYLPGVIVKMRVGGASNKSLKNIILKSKEDISALKLNSVGGILTLAWKNLSKIPQFIKR